MYEKLLDLTWKILILRGGHGLVLVNKHMPGKHSQKTHGHSVRPGKLGGFSTPEQAQKWLKDKHGIDADLSGFSPKQVNEISAGIDKVARIYKGDLPVNKIEQVTGVNYAARAGGKSIKINPDTFNDDLIKDISDPGIAKYRSSQKRLERAKKQLKELGEDSEGEYKKVLEERVTRLEDKVNNFKPVPFGASRDFGDLIIHEVAHEIHIDLGKENFANVTDFLPPSKMRELGIDFTKTLSARLDRIASGQGLSISEYATTNSQEYFAESFVRYTQGESKNIHPDLLGVFKRITR